MEAIEEPSGTIFTYYKAVVGLRSNKVYTKLKVFIYYFFKRQCKRNQGPNMYGVKKKATRNLELRKRKSQIGNSFPSFAENTLSFK